MKKQMTPTEIKEDREAAEYLKELFGKPKNSEECPIGGKHIWKIRRGLNRGIFTMVGGDKIFDCANGCGATKSEP